MTYLSGDEFYDDDVTSGVVPSYPNSGPGLEPSGMSGNRSADAPPPTSSDGGSPETERATSNVDSPDRTQLRGKAWQHASNIDWLIDAYLDVTTVETDLGFPVGLIEKARDAATFLRSLR